MLNFTNDLGQRALQRIHSEQIIWLTTVTPSGVPQPKPVWFIWDGAAFTIYSQPTAKKIRHIAQDPNVSLHFDAGPSGIDVQVLLGVAQVDPNAPLVKHMPAYTQKYQAGMAQIGMTEESYSATFSVAIRITPMRLRGLLPINVV
jgi:PPOX class probable F420-dependent enzyme